MSRRNSFLFSFGTALLILILFFSIQVGAKTDLKVFHAGSLSVPFKRLEKEFESAHPDVNVQLEAHGSVVAVRQVTDVGKKGDVVAVSDYTLIPSLMSPEYADFYLQFAQNRMVLAYTEESNLSERINSHNWYNVLANKDVRFGFSNPNMDPCGYRSPMVMQLAEIHYFDPGILNKLVLNNSKITVTAKENTYQINVPEVIRPDTGQLTIRNKETDLVALLQSGGLDYAFEYMSIAKQHGLKFIKLPRAVDLSSTKYGDLYSRVSVKTADGKIKKAKPIVYGITIPKNARHPKLAAEFLKLIISEKGRSVFSELGQPPIVPARGFGDVPGSLEVSMEEQN
ncbi:tungstate ABC transporter substrate-binding protein WtpA [Candidatus Bipolaricaulota bacterium]|nr:tungstate ABC transporter substrate-binding protein WtpA [Candidatus Bipolaricaulota bacterium]